MTMSPRANALQRRASNPANSAWVNANAGSGKTHVLVDRVIRLMLAGAEPSRILCLTFTKAAAAEMSSRILSRLAGWIGLDSYELRSALAAIGIEGASPEDLQQARRLFALAQETPGGLKIQTIHAFCERLLQLFPVEAGIVPHFAVMDDAAAKALMIAARDAVLNHAAAEPLSDVGQALTRLNTRINQEVFDELVQQIAVMAADIRPLLKQRGGHAALLLALRDALGLGEDEGQGAILAALALDACRYRQIVELLEGRSSTEQDAVAQIVPALALAEPKLTDVASLYLAKDGSARSFSRLPTKDVHRNNPWIREFLLSEQQRLTNGLGKRDDLERIEGTGSLLTIAEAIIATYEELKRQAGHYDFADLIDRTRALLAEKPDAAWVLYKLDGGIEHVLIDEAQDTSPAQWDIVRALTEEFFAGSGLPQPVRRTVFAVGDRKQSIFSFQGADPSVFEEVRQEFRDRVEGAGQAFEAVDFTVSFRSSRQVLAAVDLVFGENAPAQRGLHGSVQAVIQHESVRPKDEGIVEVWPLIEPDEHQEPEPWMAPVDQEPGNSPPRRLARLICAELQSWIGKRRIGKQERIVTPGDILVLVRRRNVFFDVLISELRRAGIPVAGADRLKLNENLAVLDLLALAAFVLLPEDDYCLACVLKSPLVQSPLTEDDLFRLAHGRGKKSLWQALRESELGVAKTARAEIEGWFELAGSTTPFGFFATLVQRHRKAIVGRLGQEANDALDAFLQAALDFEADQAPSLASFVTWFRAGDIEIKRNMEQGRGEIRVMTVHGAKGLEAPIVILPDTTGVPRRGNRPQLLKVGLGNGRASIPLWSIPKLRKSEGLAGLEEKAETAERQEFHRLLYVAMTRAGDELYICGYKGSREPADGNWYDLVSRAIEPQAKRLEDGRLRLGIDPIFVGASETERKVSGPSPGWLAVPVPDMSPGRRRQSVTDLARGDAEQSQLGSAGGRDRGLLVHRLLQLLPETPSAERQALAHRLVTRAGQPASLAGAVLGLMTTPALAPIFAADGLSEVLLTASLPDWSVELNGRIDRLLIGEAAITVVDFKTDRQWPAELDQVPASYVRQMALYRKVLQDAYPGRRVTCVLVWTEGPSVMEMPDLLLEQALEQLRPARP